LNKYVASVVRKAGAPSLLLDGTPYGPASPFEATTVAAGFPTGPGQVSPPQENAGLNADATLDVSGSQVSRTVLDVADFLEKNNQIPNAVWLGSHPVSPESYLVALAQVTTRLLVKAEPPESVTLAPARVAAEKYVAEDSPALWGWVIFPANFRAPKLMGLAKLQAWTLKPARPQASR
jgi:hypothetical protein